MRDKELACLLEPFTAQVEQWFVAPVDSERSAVPGALRDLLLSLGAASIEIHGDIATATRCAGVGASAGDRVLVFGSFYTVGPAMAALGIYCETRSVG